MSSATGPGADWDRQVSSSWSYYCSTLLTMICSPNVAGAPGFYFTSCSVFRRCACAHVAWVESSPACSLERCSPGNVSKCYSSHHLRHSSPRNKLSGHFLSEQSEWRNFRLLSSNHTSQKMCVVYNTRCDETFLNVLSQQKFPILN